MSKAIIDYFFRNTLRYREKMAVTEESANEQDDFQKVDEEENGLMGILAQWKEHLFAQKSELQDYYNK